MTNPLSVIFWSTQRTFCEIFSAIGILNRTDFIWSIRSWRCQSQSYFNEQPRQTDEPDSSVSAFSGKDMQRDTSEWKRTLWCIAEQEGIWRISSPFSDQRWLSGRLERSIVWFWLRWIESDCGLLGKHFHLSPCDASANVFTPLSVTALPLSHRDAAQADGRWLTRPVERVRPFGVF